ncbi:hypothetical protein QFC21_001863 [Naganishia friedmannii]|uniref:Uncharacterized protein n=1 Tax=Naganishia friedmannii TaxID=89922 RepID=A0ACC2W319_9TREE|nr:hypothetical protein QFC21_001863 [Naganishia friedmannii]
MAALTTSSSGLVTPISELPPSIMGEGDVANGDSHQQLPMDYFDFDLSSFASDGVLASTGINLGLHGEEDAQIDSFLDTSRGTANDSHENGNIANSTAPAAAMWGEGDQKLPGNAVESASHTSMAQGNQQLHEQLAQFHMQSPAIFAQLNGQKMNHKQQSADLYQSIPTDPGPTSGQWGNQSIAAYDRLSKRVSFGTYEGAEEVQKPYAPVQPLGPSAMPTPAQSGEMMPNMHTELVSPLPLGTGYEGGEVAGEYSINERGDILFTPLLSPAITHHGGSLHTSPQFAVESNQGHTHGQTSTTTDTQRRLESIQMQQMNLQRQLDELQQQQRQQQDQNSQSQMHQYQHQQQIYHQPQQRQTQPQDPNHTGSYVSPMVYPQTQTNLGSALSLTTGTPLQGPSPATSNHQEFFSPLGSPALGPVNHGPSVRKRHRSSLSNATSPALINTNHLPQYPPSRNAEAATVSPALLPQGALHAQRFMNMDGNNQAYLTEWAKLLSDNSSTSSSQISEVSIPSPVHRKPAELGAQSQHDGHLENYNMHSRQMNARPSSTRSPALGPHRSGNGKTRPSPMIKPSHRPGRSNLGNGNSVTSSPLVVATNGTHYSPAIMPGGHLIDGFSNGSAGSGSLSPVELSSILMPPPPPPPHRTQGNSAKFAPITPAALMQIGSVGGLSVLEESGHTPRAVYESAISLRTRNSSQHQSQPSLSQSQSQTPKAEQATLPIPAATGFLETASTHQTSGAHSGLISAIALERLRAIKPGAKTTTFRPTTKASPLLQATKNGKATKIANETNIPPEVRKSSHKQAEQRRRDSLKAGFDELRLLLPPINAEALDPETGEPIPGSSAPRLLPKSSLVPDSNPNKAVSKVALLKYSNEYIGRLNGKVERRDNYIDILKEAIRSCRHIAGFGPDEQLDELLDYAFEDEDEDEVPTGVATAQELAQQQEKDGLLQTSPDELGEADNQTQGPAAAGSKRGRKSVGGGGNNVSGSTITARGKRKPVETPAAANPASARSGRKGRRDSTLSTIVPEIDGASTIDVEAGEAGLVGLDGVGNEELVVGTDCDVDMVFDEGQHV